MPLQRLTRTPDGAAQIPWIAHHAVTGDWDPLAFAMDGVGSRRRRDPPADVLVDRLQRAVGPLEPGSDAGGGSRDVPRRAGGSRLRRGGGGVLRDAEGRAAGVVEGPRARSDVPVLLVVGVRSAGPSANVRGAVRELPSSRTIVVPNAGHGSLQLGCLSKVAQQFIERGTADGLDTRCVARYTPPPFVVR